MKTYKITVRRDYIKNASWVVAGEDFIELDEKTAHKLKNMFARTEKGDAMVVLEEQAPPVRFWVTHHVLTKGIQSLALPAHVAGSPMQRAAAIETALGIAPNALNTFENLHHTYSDALRYAEKRRASERENVRESRLDLQQKEADSFREEDRLNKLDFSDPSLTITV